MFVFALETGRTLLLVMWGALFEKLMVQWRIPTVSQPYSKFIAVFIIGEVILGTVCYVIFLRYEYFLLYYIRIKAIQIYRCKRGKIADLSMVYPIK